MSAVRWIVGESITSGQKDQLLAMVASVAGGVIDSMAREGVLTKKGAEQVRRSGDEFRKPIGNAVREALVRLSASQDFANEEVESRHGYHSGYQAPKPMVEQVAILKTHFPELASATYDKNASQGPFPEWVEGPFALLRWQLLAKTYGEAVERVLAELSKTLGGKFVNYIKGKLRSDHLRESAKKAAAFEAIAEAQKGHAVLVVPAQFGIRHRGRSVRRARAVMGSGEFGLGAFEIGIMLLTHDNRLQDLNDLWIDCAGDEYSYDAVGQFLDAPIFYFSDGELELGTGRVSDPLVSYGSVSGFSVPQ
ncbi:MAG: hypothetical protein UU40_C0013G0003 [Candidatus Uhrbacteria bacterium GW2011_GWD2_41_121]|uniref:Uncharacterized protein n=1 Tax=Candidatus Uhrbacteria bacterium GW2011_GWC1_41_20 TaxID=1618983 RepID=A0A0G0VCP9_9BACT|nr:MAG: hypothetical protein UT52_C0014G0003 [Candidatus Uhrbacteria bacterium GW2011_GWE1_39_46]KKR63733.1 MAG: hypothetical protein UU04_C0013G0004 [Candidatus Uhrbacteria bacterium GW2011_GWC2_40_450]KKR89858.1 MAG: hypothetical protein UU40_C0013G0003 [Candidatus Uhrbacteria bacterium GW2011_GWD2_41_121]KKR95707.1 MAG: hypothetical protein UU46_C0016G0020 [Candidatus Uhrbacteria bacterium GW2011_GWD1_41_16]KKR98643.1 MAG: hypothetical protein UU50_C0016G0020 [Candidatus Uhrbacteria bacteriu